MRTETTKKLFTVDDYYRMADAGIFGPGERVELIEGEIIEMSPRGTRLLHVSIAQVRFSRSRLRAEP